MPTPSTIEQRLDTLEGKIDATFKSAEKTRKYILTIVWVSVVAFVLPLVGLVFAIPAYLNMLNSLSSF